MATKDLTELIYADGELCADPTDLTIAFPHGGTPLGAVSDVVFRPTLPTQEFRGEEYGGETIESIVGGKSPALGALVRGFDKDMWTRIFLNADISPLTDKPRVDDPGTNRAGTLASTRAFKLLYSPTAPETTPGIILYLAMPMIEETAELALSVSREFGIPAIFRGIRDATGRKFQHRLLEDMDL